MLLLVYTVVSAQQAGWVSARAIGSFALVAAGLAAFVAIESRSRDPLMPASLEAIGIEVRSRMDSRSHWARPNGTATETTVGL